MRTFIAWCAIVLLAAVASGCGGDICDVSAGDLSGTYRMSVDNDGQHHLFDLTFSEAGVEIVELDPDDPTDVEAELVCSTGETAFCALEIVCVNEAGRPRVRFMWSLDE